MARQADGTIYINTQIDSNGFNSGVGNIKNSVNGLGKAFGKLGVAIGGAFAITQLVKFGKEAIDLGSDLQEVQNVVDVTFTTMSDKVDEFARNAAKTAGLSETMAKKYTGTFGAMAKAFGFAEEDAFEMSTALTQLSGDVASFYNLSQDEAYTKLKSVFTGETESLKDLGVVMTQTALDSYAMANGFGKTTKQMSEQEKVALRYSFVLDQLSSASGDFQRTSDGWANQMRILNLNLESFKANIGQGLINLFTPLLQMINALVERLTVLGAKFREFTELVMGKKESKETSTALGKIENGYSNVADATEDAAKAQQKYLSGLDEIRTFNDNEAENSIFSGTIGLDSAITGNTNNIGLEVNVEGIEKFTQLNGIILGVIEKFELFKIVALDLFNLFAKPLIDNKEGFLYAASNIVEFMGGIVSTITSGIDKAFGYFETVYLNEVQPVIHNITDDLSEIVSNLLSWWQEDMEPVLTRWGESFSEMWDEHIDPLFKNLASFFGDTAKNVDQLWKETLKPFIDWFTEKILPAVTPVIEGFGEAFINKLGSMADWVSAFIQKLNGFITFVTGVFTADWEQAWEGLTEIFKGIINQMTSVFEGAINWIIDSLNALIDGANSLGTSIGVNLTIPNIPRLDIPKLATGAVIPPNAPFMAMLGDQKHGTNIEAPLDTIKQALSEVMGESYGQYSFTAQINRRTLFEEIIDEAKLRQSANGRNPFEL